jgi:hypothetical protein
MPLFMKTFLLTVFISLTAPLLLCAQKQRTEDFQLALPEQKIQNSLYNSIRFIDARYDTALVGAIQRGVFNDKVMLVTSRPLEEQARSVLTALTDSSARPGELVLHVRQFSLAEITGSFSERGYCYVRANLFAASNGSYKMLSKFDSVIVIKGGDVTKGLLKAGSEVMSGFIASNLLKGPVETESYTLDDIYKIDSFEKRGLTIYNTDVYKDGVYRSFRSFVDQTPDGQITAKVKKKQIWDIYTVNEKGKKEQVWQKDTYAVIYNGVPYISTEYDYYPLQKRDNDFYFTGKAKATANSGEVMMASMLFGLVGGLLASNASGTFEMKIDHLSGGFIRLKEAKK